MPTVPWRTTASTSGWEKRKNVPKRIRGSQLQTLRRRLLQAHPVCQVCHQRAATIRDHLVNLAAGGTEDPNNIQAICADCHRAKTGRESARARGGQ